MAEITIKLRVPDGGMEDKVKKLVEETVKKFMQPKSWTKMF
ncbi:hypothetical protein [Archaeoglobus sp.]